MNERIQELADKIWAEEYWDKPNTDKLLPAQLNRFAELIVRQCIGMVLPYNEEDPCAERLYELADTIGEHFGVEE